MISNQAHIKALKNYIDDPTATDELKLDIIQWMWENRQELKTPAMQNDKFQNELDAFIILVIKRER